MDPIHTEEIQVLLPSNWFSNSNLWNRFETNGANIWARIRNDWEKYTGTFLQN